MEHNDAFIDSLDCENLLTEEQLKENYDKFINIII